MELTNNTEKGKVIFKRCKVVLPQLLRLLKVYSVAIVHNSALWEANLGAEAASFWLGSAKAVTRVLDRYGEALYNNENLFVSELFSKRHSFLVCYFIQHVSIDVIKDSDYLDTVSELFRMPQN